MKQEQDPFHGYELGESFSRKLYAYLTYACLPAYSGLQKDEWFTGVGILVDSKDHLCSWRYAVKDYGCVKKFFARILENHDEIKELDKGLVEQNKIIKQLAKQKPSLLSNEELAQLFNSYYKAMHTLIFYSALIRFIDIELVPYLIKKQQRKEITPDELATLVKIKRDSFFVQEKKSILNSAKKIKDNKIKTGSSEFNKKIKELHENFCWTTLGLYNQEPRPLDYYVKEVSSKLGKADKLISELKNKEKNDLARRKELLRTLSDDKKLMRAVELASELAYLKDFFKQSLNKATYKIESLFEEIEERSGKSKDLLKDYLPQEIEQACLGKTLPDEIVQERIRHYVFYAIPDPVKIIGYEGKEADEFEEKNLQTEREEIEILKGRGVSKGKVTGRVVRVAGHDEFSKIKKGDIMVVGNTTPDYVVILEKVGAIIAEEGGFTAHVSIISREFNMPAVVGIGGVTKILKDGERVEVDANKGIVRKLNE